MESNSYVSILSPDTIAAVDKHPEAAAVLIGLVVFALICWVAVAWIKNRRR